MKPLKMEWMKSSAVGLEDKRERSREVALHQLERVVAYLGVFAYVAQVVADDGKLWLARVDVLELADAFDWTLFQRVASDGIHGVRRVDDDASFVEYVNYPLDVIRIVVL